LNGFGITGVIWNRKVHSVPYPLSFSYQLS
jgi:hypothetical protein